MPFSIWLLKYESSLKGRFLKIIALQIGKVLLSVTCFLGSLCMLLCQCWVTFVRRALLKPDLTPKWSLT